MFHSNNAPESSKNEIIETLFKNLSDNFWKLHIQTHKINYCYLPYEEDYCRFANIPLIEETAVHKLEGVNKTQFDEMGKFLHANSVEGDGLLFFATQYPYPADDLYWALGFEKGRVLVDLTTPMDNELIINQDGVGDNEIYFPIQQKKPLLCNHFSISLLEKQIEEGNPEVVFYTYEVISLNKNEKTILKRIHFTGWYDHRGLDFKKLKRLISVLEKYIHPVDRYPIINCRAGVGRTGTLIAGMRMLKRIKEGRTTWDTLQKDLDEVILNVRKQRGPDSVQTERQYLTLMFLCVDALKNTSHHNDL